MRLKAVSFDIGHTLVNYPNPLDWKSLYAPAVERVFAECAISGSPERLRQAAEILTSYNTRENPREHEVNSDIIFQEIFDAWAEPHDKIPPAKAAFYGFFQAGAVLYDDAEAALRFLRDKGLKLGALTDVAYGMDNAYSLRDIEAIRWYFDAVLTSVDVGFRKPGKAGFLELLRLLGVSPAEMLYVGDEEKDIAGAKAAGAVSALIVRGGERPDYGQDFTAGSLSEICGLIP
ncbi:MAG: HAD family hydrolase [Firmicutes bacterium]|nr:HAD family hydrolase [Bacillota bacterium]